ncbi:Hypothetical protein PBC10988_32720 [Planctomycetales bacterium 10988]|nr:Hypothetical protein PBC10988_32720 [Planctomycetales bacterium 10988]
MNLANSAIGIFLFILGMFLSVGVNTLSAWQLPPTFAELRFRQEAQARTSRLAEALVSGILDLQLRQLEENGMQDRPFYQDIRSMRDNISGLVATEMAEVVVLLRQTQTAEDPEVREYSFQRARELIRQIVLKLATERQHLARRLKTAEIVTQVKRLQSLQSLALRMTRTLPEQLPQQRDLMALSAREDQQVILDLYQNLMATMENARTWEGSLGVGISEGLLLLETEETEIHLESALAALDRTEYLVATDHQVKVLSTLDQLLSTIEELQGLIGQDQASLLEMVRDLKRRQSKLQERTMRMNPNDVAAAKELENQQSLVQESLETLKNALLPWEAWMPLAEAAQEAAYQAATDLFRGDQASALTQQAQVIGNLAALEERLGEEVVTANQALDSEGYQRLVRELKEVKRQLEILQPKQEEATQASAETPQQSLDITGETAEILDALVGSCALPVLVEARLRQAIQISSQAERQLEENLKPGIKENLLALQEVEQVLQRTAMEVDSALSHALRRQLAIELGELMRAREVLERTAAEQRKLQSMLSEATTTAARQELAERQEQVRDLAESIASATRQTSPESQTPLNRATTAAKQVLAELDFNEAEEPISEEMIGQQRAILPELEAAIEQMRDTTQQKAESLLELTESQLAEVSASRQALESQIAQQLPTQAEQLARLASAQRNRLEEETFEENLEEIETREESELKIPATTSEPSEEAGPKPEEDSALEEAGVEESLLREVANLSTREARIRSDQDQAEAILEALEEQLAAAEALAEMRELLQASDPEKESNTNTTTLPGLNLPETNESNPNGNMPGPNSEETPASEEHQERMDSLEDAIDSFAASQDKIGEEIAKFLEQEEVTLPTLQEALEEASELPSPFSPAEKDQPTKLPADPSQQSPSSEPASPVEAALPNSEEGTEGSGNSEAPPKGTPPTAEGGSQTGSQAGLSGQAGSRDSRRKDAPLGTGFVPESSRQTAERMAGPQAMQQLQASRQERMATQGEENQAGTPESPNASNPTATPNPQEAESQENSQANSAKSGDGKESDGDSSTSREGQIEEETSRSAKSPVEVREENFEQTPWILDLPPEVRNAIRSGIRRRPPRGYEDRLQRYYQNLD